MLVLNVKKGNSNKIYIGEGEDQVVVMLSDASINPDGTIVAKLAFDAPKHICIDRESVRQRRISKVDNAVKHTKGASHGNPKD